MTAHRRALLLKAGAVAVLATGALLGISTPAFAATTVDLSQTSLDMNAGDVKIIDVNLGGDPDNNVDVTFTAPSANGNITIKSAPSGCNISNGTVANCNNLVVVTTLKLTFQLQAKSPSTLQPGQNLTDQPGSVSASGGETKSFKVNLKGPGAAPTTQAATPTVTEVSGTVTDSTTGKTLKGAQVVMEDGAGKSRQTQADDLGRYKFTGTAANPIAPGGITVQAGLDGYENGQKQTTGQAGKAVNLKVPLAPLAASASAAPLPTAGDGLTPDATATGGVAPQNTNTTNTSGSGASFSWVLIALGALLVVFGIVAIVLLLRRRGDDDDDEPDEDGPAPRRGGPGRPGYRGGPPQADPTMVGAMGPGATMVNRGNVNDATAIVHPGRLNDYDVPPDPYAAPPRTGYPPAPPANLAGYNDQAGFASGGYGGAGGGAPAGGGYGPSSRPPVDPYGPDYGNGNGGGYGAGAGGGANGYEQQGYADSTQRYEPGAGNYGGSAGAGAGGGYGAGGANGGGSGQGGYGGGANGYGPDGPQTGGYGNGPQSDGGYGAGQGGYGSGGQGGGQGGPSAGGYGDNDPGYGPGGGGGNDPGYGPSAGNGYGPSAGNGYSGAGGGAGGGADYDGPYAGRGGYEPAAGYERDGYERVPEPPRAGNGYTAGGPGDYEQRGGYGPSAGNGGGGGAGDYEQRGGYGPSAGNGGGGDGYDDGARSPNGQRGGNRRSLDWLDD